MKRSRFWLVRRSSRIALLVLGLGLLLALVAAWPSPSHPPEIERLWRVQIVAHRGGLIERPDSTLAAYDHAVNVGADWLELDVHLSADGVPVIIHDDTVDRTTNGHGRVAELTLAELRRLDAGYRWPEDMAVSERRFVEPAEDRRWRGQGLAILTLDEFLGRYREHRLMIEIKPPGEAVVEAVLADLFRHGRENSVVLASFHEATLLSVRQRAPQVATVASASEARRFIVLANVGLSRFWPRSAEVLAIPPRMGQRNLVTRRVVDAARKIGVPIHVWTINDPEQWDRLIDLGVDGILTDRPEALRAHLNRRRLGRPE